MVQVTKGKNVVIETYDAEFKEFTATAAQTDFTMANKAGETTPEYTRVYVDNVEVASADITVSSATPAVVAPSRHAQWARLFRYICQRPRTAHTASSRQSR